MDKRREARFEVDQQVTVTLLGSRKPGIPGTLVNISGRGVGLALTEALPLGGALRIDADDNLFIGEVVYCRPVPAGFEVGVALEQVLRNLTELRTLNEKLFAGARR